MRRWFAILALIGLAGCGGSKASGTGSGSTGTAVGGACKPDECGPRPMYFQMCPDGSGVGAESCERGPSGCAWKMGACPEAAATSSTGTGTTGPAECTCKGDKPMMEALCPDGKTTVGATGRCIATGGGCSWEMTKCP